MPSNNKTIVKEGIKGDGEFEITLDDSAKGIHRITIPLFYDFILSPVVEKGKGVPVSSLEMSDTKTIVNVPNHVPQLKLKVIKPRVRSSMDNQGNTSPPTGNEDGDRFSNCAVEFVDWLKTRKESMDEKTEEFVRFIQGAEREIIIQKI